MPRNAAGRVKKWLTTPLKGESLAKLAEAIEELKAGTCRNCEKPFDPEALDIHRLCPDCSAKQPREGR